MKTTPTVSRSEMLRQICQIFGCAHCPLMELEDTCLIVSDENLLKAYSQALKVLENPFFSRIYIWDKEGNEWVLAETCTLDHLKERVNFWAVTNRATVKVVRP